MARFRWQQGFGTIGKDEKESVCVLLRETNARGYKLVLESGNDGAEIVISPYCIEELIQALGAAKIAWDQRRLGAK